MSTLQEAVQELINRALHAPKESTCDLLLGSAKRLDPATDVPQFKMQWLKTWLVANKDRKKDNE